MRILFAIPGFHRYDRGAEVALLAVAQVLASGGDQITVMGSGPPRAGVAYSYRQVGSIARERFEKFPKMPVLRSETAWEDATFAAGLMASYRPADFDAAVTCSFPFTHWALRRPALGARPKQIFVTQNGDWPAFSDSAEYRTFRCDGLVCTNPDFAARNRERWRVALIPNGISPGNFAPRQGDRAHFGLPKDRPVVLMVSALIESKRVIEGIRAVGKLDGVHLAVAGDGALRDSIKQAALTYLPGRFSNLTVKAEAMPALYNSADVFLHMSLLESFGNVFVEAAASGLPVVAHDTTRLRWIVGDDQPLCDTTDEASLIAALRRALETGQRAAPARIAEFHWPSIARQYRSFIAEVTGTGASQ